MSSYPKDVDLKPRKSEVSTQLWGKQYPVETPTPVYRYTKRERENQKIFTDADPQMWTQYI